MELCDAATNDEDRLIAATRALFTLRRAARRVDASVAWARVSASVLAGSRNRAIAAEAKRLQGGLYDFNRPYGLTTPDAASASEVVWVSFSRA